MRSALRGLVERAAAAARRLSPRERFLGLAILGTLATGWASAQSRQLAELRTRAESAAAARQAQDAWLAIAPVLKKSLAARAAGLGAARSLTPEAVLGRLEKLQAASGLAGIVTRPDTREAGACRAHTVRLDAPEATLAQLVAFRRALDTCGLPMAVTATEIDAGRDGDKLRIRLVITALQPLS